MESKLGSVADMIPVIAVSGAARYVTESSLGKRARKRKSKRHAEGQYASSYAYLSKKRKRTGTTRRGRTGKRKSHPIFEV